MSTHDNETLRFMVRNPQQYDSCVRGLAAEVLGERAHAKEARRLLADAIEDVASVTAERDALMAENGTLRALVREALGTHGDTCEGRGCSFKDRARAALGKE